jgi:hypothetical protein
MTAIFLGKTAKMLFISILFFFTIFIYYVKSDIFFNFNVITRLPVGIYYNILLNTLNVLFHEKAERTTQ